MKSIILILLGIVLAGCVSDVSDKPPHNKLTGTVWKLKTDAYVIEYADNRRRYIIIPNADRFGAYLNYKVIGEPYNEDNIGKKLDGVKIVGGLRAGESLTVMRVSKHPHIEMGTSYRPMMIPEKLNAWTKEKELDGAKLYRGRDKTGKFFNEQGIMNPQYIEIIRR